MGVIYRIIEMREASSALSCTGNEPLYGIVDNRETDPVSPSPFSPSPNSDTHPSLPMGQHPCRSSGLPSFPCPLPIHPSRQEFSPFSPFPSSRRIWHRILFCLASLDKTSTRQHHIPTHPNHDLCIGGLQSLRFALLEKTINTRSLSVTKFTLLPKSIVFYHSPGAPTQTLV